MLPLCDSGRWVLGEDWSLASQDSVATRHSSSKLGSALAAPESPPPTGGTFEEVPVMGELLPFSQKINSKSEGF